MDSIRELQCDALERVALECEPKALLAMRAVCKEWRALASTDYLWMQRLSALLVKYPAVPTVIGSSSTIQMYFAARRLADFEDLRDSGYVAGAYPHLSRYGKVSASGLPEAAFAPTTGQKLVLQGAEYGTICEAVNLFAAHSQGKFLKAAQLFDGLPNNTRSGLKYVWELCHPSKGLKEGERQGLLSRRYRALAGSDEELLAVRAEATTRRQQSARDGLRTPGLDSRARAWQRRYARSESEVKELQVMVLGLEAKLAASAAREAELQRDLAAEKAAGRAKDKLISQLQAELQRRTPDAEVQELREQLRVAQKESRIKDRIISDLRAQLSKREKAVASAKAKEGAALEALQKAQREGGEAQRLATAAAKEANSKAKRERERAEAALRQ